MNSQSALILLDKPIILDIEVIVGALRQRHPILKASPFVGSSNNAPSAAVMWLIKYAGKVVAIRYNPERVPEDEPLIDLSAWHWPNARDAYNRHQANIHIWTVEREEDPLPLARVVTAVVGAVIDVTPGCLAVIYNSKVMQSVEFWQKLSTLAFSSAPNYPFQLWVFLNPYKHEGGTLITTIGLAPLIGREIEFEGDEDRNAAAQCTATTIRFLFDKRTPLCDGDTLSFPESKRYQVFLRYSARFEQLPVFLVKPFENNLS